MSTKTEIDENKSKRAKLIIVVMTIIAIIIAATLRVICWDKVDEVRSSLTGVLVVCTSVTVFLTIILVVIECYVVRHRGEDQSMLVLVGKIYICICVVLILTVMCVDLVNLSMLITGSILSQ